MPYKFLFKETTKPLSFLGNQLGMIRKASSFHKNPAPLYEINSCILPNKFLFKDDTHRRKSGKTIFLPLCPFQGDNEAPVIPLETCGA